MQPKRLASDERRAQIIETARILFCRYGCDQTTTSTLARAAGISEPVLYRYFPSKRALIVAVIRDAQAREEARCRRLLAENGHPLQAVQRILGEICRADYNGSYRMVWRSHLNAVEPDVREAAAAAIERRRRFLAEALRAAAVGGWLRPGVDIEAVAFHLLSLELGLSLAPDVCGGPPESRFKAIWESLFSGVFKVPQPATARSGSSRELAV